MPVSGPRRSGPPPAYPCDGAAWLYRVAERRARERFTPDPPDVERSAEEAMIGDTRLIPDERLRLIFVCCTRRWRSMRAALTLRLICGLSAGETEPSRRRGRAPEPRGGFGGSGWAGCGARRGRSLERRSARGLSALPCGSRLRRLGRLDEAQAAYDAALALGTESAECLWVIQRRESVAPLN